MGTMQFKMEMEAFESPRTAPHSAWAAPIGFDQRGGVRFHKSNEE
jgi:hypothetical protein